MLLPLADRAATAGADVGAFVVYQIIRSHLILVVAAAGAETVPLALTIVPLREQKSRTIRTAPCDCWPALRPQRVGRVGGRTPKIGALSARRGAAQILREILKAYKLVKLLERGHLVGYDLRRGKRGPTAMQRTAITPVLGLFLCLSFLASSTALARRYRVVVEPCFDRCKSTRLSICSACMGGTKTCAQQHVCSNNRSVVCGGESTVTVPCWNQRYRW